MVDSRGVGVLCCPDGKSAEIDLEPKGNGKDPTGIAECPLRHWGTPYFTHKDTENHRYDDRADSVGKVDRDIEIPVSGQETVGRSEREFGNGEARVGMPHNSTD
jgi:hypothetical protein